MEEEPETKFPLYNIEGTRQIVERARPQLQEDHFPNTLREAPYEAPILPGRIIDHSYL